MQISIQWKEIQEYRKEQNDDNVFQLGGSFNTGCGEAGASCKRPQSDDPIDRKYPEEANPKAGSGRVVVRVAGLGKMWRLFKSTVLGPGR